MKLTYVHCVELGIPHPPGAGFVSVDAAFDQAMAMVRTKRYSTVLVSDDPEPAWRTGIALGPGEHAVWVAK